METHESLVLLLCITLFALVLLKAAKHSHFSPLALLGLAPDPAQAARIEHDQEEIAYQNAIRWEPAEHRDKRS